LPGVAAATTHLSFSSSVSKCMSTPFWPPGHRSLSPTWR
jgi:hypothetical protein